MEVRLAEVTPWMPVALQELGTREVAGPGDAPRIVAYHQATALGARDDEVPWCSSFVAWVMERAGYVTTRSAAARSWQTWGVETEPRFGAITVLERGGPATGHVGFWVDADASRVWLLGGNQGDAVTIAPFARTRVLSCRWPA